MATEATLQVIPSSADVPGMSVVTASRNREAPRSGIAYNTATLAAAQPVWFHPLQDGAYLTLFSRRLTGATVSPVSADGVLLYTDYAVSTAPGWAAIDAHTGGTHGIADIPSEQPGIRTLISAFSRGDYLFTLSEYKKSADDDDTFGLLQNFRVVGRDGISLLGEEMVPLDLRLGIYADRRHLWLFGDVGAGKLGMARKSWARIGTSADANPTMNWQFWGKGDWTSDPTLVGSFTDARGVDIPAQGPCSMARYRDTYYLMVSTATSYPATVPVVVPPPVVEPPPIGGVEKVVTSWIAAAPPTPQPSWSIEVYTNRRVQQNWTRHPFTRSLARTAGLYQDGGGYLQEQIPLTPGYSVTTAAAAVSLLDEFSDHIQVVTGTGPHTVVLPPTAKPVGTLLSVEGGLQPPPATTGPVSYMPYTVHNQSTSDIVVMMADRDRQVVVPHGTGLTFTPYVPEPTLSRNWSWNFAAERAPRPRQGFPFLSTRKLAVTSYRLAITGAPESGSFRLVHNGFVTASIDYLPGNSAATRTALASALSSLGSVTVTAESAQVFRITVTDDFSQLRAYSYHFVDGTAPAVAVTTTASVSTLLTQWSVFEPEVKPAAPSGLVKATPPPAAVTPSPPSSALVDLLGQFTSVVTVVASGVIAVGAGVVATITGLVGEAVYLVTGDRSEDSDGIIGSLVTDFLQELAGQGATDSAATSFENILRQITGGTGVTGADTQPTPIDFVQGVVDAAEEIIETLADWLQKIINAITGR